MKILLILLALSISSCSLWRTESTSATLTEANSVTQTVATRQEYHDGTIIELTTKTHAETVSKEDAKSTSSVAHSSPVSDSLLSLIPKELTTLVMGAMGLYGAHKAKTVGMSYYNSVRDSPPRAPQAQPEVKARRKEEERW